MRLYGSRGATRHVQPAAEVRQGRLSQPRTGGDGDRRGPRLARDEVLDATGQAHRSRSANPFPRLPYDMVDDGAEVAGFLEDLDAGVRRWCRLRGSCGRRTSLRGYFRSSTTSSISSRTSSTSWWSETSDLVPKSISLPSMPKRTARHLFSVIRLRRYSRHADVAAAQLHQLGDQAQDQRREAGDLLDLRADVGKAKLQRRELRVRADVPPDLRRLVDAIRLQQHVEELLVLRPARERRRQACSRKRPEDDRAVATSSPCRGRARTGSTSTAPAGAAGSSAPGS